MFNNLVMMLSVHPILLTWLTISWLVCPKSGREVDGRTKFVYFIIWRTKLIEHLKIGGPKLCMPQIWGMRNEIYPIFYEIMVKFFHFLW